MKGLVTTIEDRCRRCYSCVRNCPAKAIGVEDGQARVIVERCVGCGNCVRVCAQSAKKVESGIEQVCDLLADRNEYVIAGLAPSFPAAFPEVRPGQLVTALKRLGFAEVVEVAFGAELVAAAFRTLSRANGDKPLISSACPAVVAYVEKYLPSLVPYLAPIVSPMGALGRAVKQKYHPGARLVFIGPCIAKKAERREEDVAEYVDAVLTFQEARDMLRVAGINLSELPESSFGGLTAGTARIFPVSGGLLRTAALAADILDTEIVVAEGAGETVELLHELADGTLQVRLLDALFCEGCISGPRITGELSTTARREAVAEFARRGRAAENESSRRLRDEYAAIDLRRRFTACAAPQLPVPSEEEIREALRRTKKLKPEDELNCGACGYPTCREKAVAVCQGLAEAEMCLPYLIEQLQENYGDLERMHKELQETQAQLIQSEKLASMGQLAAGVAHEVNNPLGTIMLCSHMLLRGQADPEEQQKALKMIVDEATRCRSIVSGLLNFARQGKLALQDVQLNELVCDTFALVEQQPIFAGIETEMALDSSLTTIEADAAQLKDVFLNIILNAAEAMNGHGRFTIYTRDLGEKVEVSFVDTGCGIPAENLSRIFNPFFTTKQIGQGTGLGLAIAYGIVKMHKGQILVHSEVGRGSTFTVVLPKRLREQEAWSVVGWDSQRS